MLTTYNKSLHGFSIFVAICTFLLIVAGGLVTSTGSGLAVPDWPLSYGQLMPPMLGGIFYEHTHRMVATFVGLLTIILAVWIWRKERRRGIRFLSLAALLLVILQGLLGGLTVLLLLPTAVSVGHALLAQTFFCLTVSIALFTSRWWILDSLHLLEREPRSSTIYLCTATTLALFLQLVLGAVMRHTHSGLAVPDFPLSYGQFFPSLSPESIAIYNEELIHSDIRLAADGPITSTQIVLHLFHRYWALVVGAMILWTSVRLREISSRRLTAFVYLLVGLMVVQISLGAWSVLSRKAVEVATAHVAIGALLLGSSVLALLHLVRLSRLSVAGIVFSTVREEAIA